MIKALLALLGLVFKLLCIAAVGAYAGFCWALFWEPAKLGYGFARSLLPWVN